MGIMHIYIPVDTVLTTQHNGSKDPIFFLIWIANFFFKLFNAYSQVFNAYSLYSKLFEDLLAKYRPILLAFIFGHFLNHIYKSFKWFVVFRASFHV